MYLLWTSSSRFARMTAWRSCGAADERSIERATRARLRTAPGARGLHVLEDEVDVEVVLGADHVPQLDDVDVAPQLEEVRDLPIRPLAVGRARERVEALLQRHDAPLPAPFDALPDDAVGAAPEPPADVDAPLDPTLHVLVPVRQRHALRRTRRPVRRPRRRGDVARRVRGATVALAPLAHRGPGEDGQAAQSTRPDAAPRLEGARGTFEGGDQTAYMAPGPVTPNSAA